MATLTSTIQERIALPGSVQRPGEDGASVPSAAEIMAMLRRRAVLILILFTLFSGMSLGGFAAWARYFPGFRSFALIECISDIPEAQLSVEQRRLKQDEHARFVMTQAVYLKSPVILGKALKITRVRDTHWYKSLEPDERLLQLTRDISAAPVRGTNFLRVSMQCRKPKDPAIIVNEVVSLWFHSVKKRAAEEFADDALDATQQEIEALEREIGEDRDRLQAIVERLPPGATQAPGENITHQEVRQYAFNVTQLKLELAQLEQFRDVYNNPRGVAVTAEDRAIVEQDPVVAHLARELFQLEQQRGAASKVYGSQHAVLKQLDARITVTEQKLGELRVEKLRDRQADIRDAANTAYDNTRHALRSQQEQLRRAEAALEDQDRLMFQYETLNAELDRKLEGRDRLTEYSKSLLRVKTQRTAIRVNIVQQAIDPLLRSSPSLLLLPLGILLALGLSGGVAVGLEMIDKSVRTSQDIIRHLDVPLLGLVPHTNDEEVDIVHVETAVRDAPRSMIAEVFRRIRTNLQFSAPAERQRTLLVTSSHPDDGKTTVACNLAMSVAQGGRRVLLVDANFRRPAISRVFEADQGGGLSNLLVGNGTLTSLAVKTNVPLLDILGSGPTPPNPVELLGSDRFREFLQESMSHYEQVIIDAAPVLLASDTLVLGAVVDGVVFVVRAHRNSRGVVRRACNLLSDVGVHVFGVVLNAVQVTRGGYFREQLRSYYEYHSDAEPTPAQPLEPMPTEPALPSE